MFLRFLHFLLCFSLCCGSSSLLDEEEDEEEEELEEEETPEEIQQKAEVFRSIRAKSDEAKSVFIWPRLIISEFYISIYKL